MAGYPESDPCEEPRETSGMTSRLILSYVERHAGRDAVDATLERAGLAGREAELRDENRWFSFATKVGLFEAAAEVLGDDRVAEHMGRAVVDLDIGGGLKRVLRALGTPGLVYRNIVRACGKFNWTHRMTTLAIDRDSARIAYEDVSGTGYHRHDCDYTIGMLSVVPEIFGLPAARVRHTECALRGAPACVYDVRWTERPGRFGWAPLPAAGATAAAAVAGAAGLPAGTPLAAALAVCTAGLAATTLRRSRRHLDGLRQRLDEHDEAGERLVATLRDLSTDLRPDEVLAKIADNAQAAVGGKEYALLLAERGRMRAVRASGASGRSLAPLEAWAATELGETGPPAVVVDDVTVIPELAPLADDPAAPAGSLCAAPLRFRGRLLGVLVALAHGTEAFLPHDGDLLSLYAAQAAISLSNATLVERLQRLADQDPLTGLANQRHLHRLLAAEVSRAEREGGELSLAMLDLDHFKRINDTHGHPRGDEILRAVAAALRTGVRPYDVVARMGGEEFALLLPGLGTADALVLVERLRGAVAGVAVESSTLTCSVGVASFPHDTGDPTELMRCADLALYDAKRAGRDRARAFVRNARPGAGGEGDAMLARLRELLEEPGAVQMVHQPIVRLATGRTVAFESLSRFPTMGGLAPDAVFRVAHQHGVGPELEAAAVRAALAKPGRPAGMTITVNVSLTALASPSIWAALPDDLADVVVEVTEHELYESDVQLQTNLARLRERGARVAVDDAGAGYAGLQQLVRVAPEIVKLDRSLVQGVWSDPAKLALIEAFVGFATTTGALVCAEGVEELDDLRTVAGLDVVAAQGFLLARPGLGWPEVDAAVTAQVAARTDAGVRALDARVAGRPGLSWLLAETDLCCADGDAAGAARLAAAACGAEMVILRVLGADGETLTALGSGAAPLSLRRHPSRRHILEVLGAGQVLRRDPSAAPEALATLDASGHDALLLVAVTDRGRAVGLLEAYRTQERPWSRDEAERVRVLAGHLAPLMARAASLRAAA